uniref:Uncharacterized protein n=1 Tax=Octopus bimaculoides TaxID=37653 RepID=A0A0L8I714_OCTBM
MDFELVLILIKILHFISVFGNHNDLEIIIFSNIIVLSMVWYYQLSIITLKLLCFIHGSVYSSLNSILSLYYICDLQKRAKVDIFGGSLSTLNENFYE